MKSTARSYDMKCSIEGSTGVERRDLRYDDRPGATIVTDCDMVLWSSPIKITLEG
jgi:hypothetical protein